MIIAVPFYRIWNNVAILWWLDRSEIPQILVFIDSTHVQVALHRKNSQAMIIFLRIFRRVIKFQRSWRIKLIYVNIIKRRMAGTSCGRNVFHVFSKFSEFGEFNRRHGYHWNQLKLALLQKGADRNVANLLFLFAAGPISEGAGEDGDGRAVPIVKLWRPPLQFC